MAEFNAMADLVGPFHDAAGTARRLRVRDEALAGLRGRGSLLGVETSDGVWIYPTFQFVGGEVDPALLPALEVLKESPAWTVAVWMSTAAYDLDYLTPVEWVRTGGPSERVTRLAGHMAGRLAS